MKAICIDASPGIIHGSLPSFIEGEIVNLIHDEGEYYFVEGHIKCLKDGRPCSWLNKRFIPLSEIDETQLVNEKEMVV